MEQFSVELDLPEGTINLAFDKINEPKRLSEVVVNLLSLGDIVTQMGTKIASKYKQTVQCKKGCGVCCCQLVPLSPPEAVIINEVVEKLPIERKFAVMESFKKAYEILIKENIYEKLFEIYSNRVEERVVLDVNKQYFNLHIPCPFLFDGSCSIYPVRPSRCREYSVLSNAELCADPFVNHVKRLPVTIKFCESLSFAWSSLMKKPPVIIPLIGALDWVSKNEDSRNVVIEGAESFIKAILNYTCKSAYKTANEKLKGSGLSVKN